MPDIALRFHKDMLVLSAPVLPALERLGVDVDRDAELTLLLEPDTFEEFYKMEAIAGAQCIVAGTGALTPARLTQARMEDRGAELVRLALRAVSAARPQHVLVEIGPCGLPLDASSKASLVENRDQYARAGRLLEGAEFDAFFLEGFEDAVDLKCALMGLRKVSDKPIVVSVKVEADGALCSGRGTLEDALAVAGEFGASVAGFSTSAGQDEAVELTRRAAATTNLPVLVELQVGVRDSRQQGPTPENPYYSPDMMVPAADALRAAGAQFLRAVGNATPAYTGALAATTLGLDARPRKAAPSPVDELPYSAGASGAGELSDGEGLPDELADLVAKTRRRVTEALAGNLKMEMEEAPSLLGGDEVAFASDAERGREPGDGSRTCADAGSSER